MELFYQTQMSSTYTVADGIVLDLMGILNVYLFFVQDVNKKNPSSFFMECFIVC